MRFLLRNNLLPPNGPKKIKCYLSAPYPWCYFIWPLAGRALTNRHTHGHTQTGPILYPRPLTWDGMIVNDCGHGVPEVQSWDRGLVMIIAHLTSAQRGQYYELSWLGIWYGRLGHRMTIWDEDEPQDTLWTDDKSSIQSTRCKSWLFSL